VSTWRHRGIGYFYFEISIYERCRRGGTGAPYQLLQADSGGLIGLALGWARVRLEVDIPVFESELTLVVSTTSCLDVLELNRN
jgi:hypothetical protein